MNGLVFPLQLAFSAYMTRWFNSIYADTAAVQEFTQRGLARAISWAPGRMVDAAEDMLKAYQKNDNGPKGQNSLLPALIVAMAKDYVPTGADVGGKQVHRQLVAIDDGPDASMYGYRQAEGDVRTQVAIFSGDSPSAKSLAAQFSWFVAQVENRRFPVRHKFGQYEFDLSATLENPDIAFMEVKTEQKNITILVADLTLRMLLPFFDAPKEGEPNDGSSNNPPGYPKVAIVEAIDEVSQANPIITEDGITWQ